MQEKVSKKEPYSLYPSLEKQGVQIVWGDPQDASSAPSGDFEVVYDNNGKKLETCQPLIDKYKATLPTLAPPPIYRPRQHSPLHNFTFMSTTTPQMGRGASLTVRTIFLLYLSKSPTLNKTQPACAFA